MPLDPETPDDNAANANQPPRRRIRSFVLRMGRLTAGQERALTEHWPHWGVDYQPAQLDLEQLFGRRAPRLVEIGFGSGEALAAFARAHPEMDCLGIEVHRPGVGQLFLRAAAQQLTNVRASHHDAVEVLTDQLGVASIDQVHIFFPDPWHKTRHHKRRLIQPAFADVLARVIKSGGLLRLATDWQDYALHMRAVLDAHAQFINRGAASGYAPHADDRPLTRFERRGQRLGHGIWEMTYQRR